MSTPESSSQLQKVNELFEEFRQLFEASEQEIDNLENADESRVNEFSKQLEQLRSLKRVLSFEIRACKNIQSDRNYEQELKEFDERFTNLMKKMVTLKKSKAHLEVQRVVRPGSVSALRDLFDRPSENQQAKQGVTKSSQPPPSQLDKIHCHKLIMIEEPVKNEIIDIKPQNEENVIPEYPTIIQDQKYPDFVQEPSPQVHEHVFMDLLGMGFSTQESTQAAQRYDSTEKAIIYLTMKQHADQEEATERIMMDETKKNELKALTEMGFSQQLVLEALKMFPTAEESIPWLLAASDN